MKNLVSLYHLGKQLHKYKKWMNCYAGPFLVQHYCHRYKQVFILIFYSYRIEEGAFIANFIS